MSKKTNLDHADSQTCKNMIITLDILGLHRLNTYLPCVVSWIVKSAKANIAMPREAIMYVCVFAACKIKYKWQYMFSLDFYIWPVEEISSHHHQEVV